MISFFASLASPTSLSRVQSALGYDSDGYRTRLWCLCKGWRHVWQERLENLLAGPVLALNDANDGEYESSQP